MPLATNQSVEANDAIEGLVKRRREVIHAKKKYVLHSEMSRLPDRIVQIVHGKIAVKHGFEMARVGKRVIARPRGNIAEHVVATGAAFDNERAHAFHLAQTLSHPFPGVRLWSSPG